MTDTPENVVESECATVGCTRPAMFASSIERAVTPDAPGRCEICCNAIGEAQIVVARARVAAYATFDTEPKQGLRGRHRKRKAHPDSDILTEATTDDETV